jgi:hypothetical protein
VPTQATPQELGFQIIQDDVAPIKLRIGGPRSARITAHYDQDGDEVLVWQADTRHPWIY